MFAHGFAIHYSQIVPPKDVDVAMVAPKSPGHMVRRMSIRRARACLRFSPCFQDVTGKAETLTLSYANAHGQHARGRLADDLCRGDRDRPVSVSRPCSAAASPRWCKTGFETLVEAGYQPELRVFRVSCTRLKLIVDLMYQGGMSYMRYSVSDTAEYGDYTAGPRVIDEHTRATMRALLLSDIQDGSVRHALDFGKPGGPPQLQRDASRNARKHQIEHGRRGTALDDGLAPAESRRGGTRHGHTSCVQRIDDRDDRMRNPP